MPTRPPGVLRLHAKRARTHARTQPPGPHHSLPKVAGGGFDRVTASPRGNSPNFHADPISSSPSCSSSSSSSSGMLDLRSHRPVGRPARRHAQAPAAGWGGGSRRRGGGRGRRDRQRVLCQGSSPNQRGDKDFVPCDHPRSARQWDHGDS